ncbi:hypothetical protein F5Y14DRAFT_412788 [Nemania sp. NC0429]|nr:hypothetical protein F5Y14DRAFT_412788 [Nemania sp. NC0429]
MADHMLPDQDTHKEAVAGYYHPVPADFEVAPDQFKPIDGESSPAQERTIFGLRRPTFFLSLALVVVILAAAIGGGVGGSIAVQNAQKSCITNSTRQALENSSSPPTATITKTTTVTKTVNAGASSTTTTGGLVVPTGILALDCPNLSGTSQTIQLGSKAWVFEAACGIDHRGGDIAAVIVYSFHDCLQACAAHNYFSNDNTCTHITFTANQTEEIPKDYGNCWLKTDNVEDIDLGSNMYCGGTVVSAPRR